MKPLKKNRLEHATTPTDDLASVALIGRPNVGKSTLFNRLTRTKDALVAPMPGLTRDIRYGLARTEDKLFEVVDTGGITEPSAADPMAQLISRQSRKTIEEADILIFLVDAKDGLTSVDKNLFAEVRKTGKPLFVCVNKVDGPGQEKASSDFYGLGAELFFISAEHGRGTPELIEQLGAKLKALGFFKPEETMPEMESTREKISAETGAKKSTGLEDRYFEQEELIEDIIETDTEAKKRPEDEQAIKPVRVAIAGRPNAGKSSLVNCLLGTPRMLTSDIPGTTRDAIDTLLSREGARDIILRDTAGIRRKSRVSERAEVLSVIKAKQAIEDCDIAVIVLDAKEGITDQDKRIIGIVAENSKGCITAYNKWDLLKNEPSLSKLREKELIIAKKFISYAPHVNISAKTGWHVDRLLPAIDRLYDEMLTKITTGKLNNFLQKTYDLRPPPMVQGKRPKLFYATQVSDMPPSFLIFASYAELITDQYKKFLANRFRQEFSLVNSPIKLVFRSRKKDKK